MKKLLIFTILLSISLVGYAQDDLSKEEKKEIKQQLKQYKKDPASFVDKIDGYEDDISTLEENLKNANEQVSEKNMELTKAGSKIEELSGQVLDLQNELESNDDCATMPEGTTYRVQIGLYEFFHLSADAQDEVRTLLLEEVNGQSRYSIGNFATVEEAVQFKLDMIQMGIDDAFVSEYVNGERNMDFDEKNAK
ncbi:MAG: hypothetical protein ACPG4Z_06510 [Chitinophagales bacterium]